MPRKIDIVPDAGARPRDLGRATPRADADAATSDVQIRELLRTLYRRRWLVLGIVTVAIALGAVYTSVVTPLYEGRSTVVIEPESPRVLAFGDVVAREPVKPDYYETQYEILRSRSLAKATITELKLWTSPELNHTSRSLTERLPAFLRWSAARRGTAQPAGEPAGPSQEAPAEARVINAFLARLSIVPHVESRIVEIRWRSVDPELAARAANGVARAYIAHNLEFRFAVSRDASQALQQRVDEQRQRVTASETALQQFREQNDVVQGRQDISIQRLSDLNGALTRARTARMDREAVYRKLASLVSDPTAIDTFSGALSNPYIQQLKLELNTLQRQEVEAAARLGDDHPDMVKIRSGIRLADTRLRAELKKVVEAAHNDFATAEAQERSLAAALESQKREVLKDSRKAIEYDVLERNAASDRQILEALLQRTKEAGITGELTASNIRILDLAEVPTVPMWPRRSLILLIATLLGGLVAALAAFTLEYLDDRIASSEEIWTHLRLRPLGLVPTLRRPDLTVPGIASADYDVSHFSERFRFVRANALFSSARNGTRCFVVTSAGPGEGKTVVASNLACALSRAGDRVLLIDADMRSPRVHLLFNLARVPGLSDLLKSAATPAEVIRPSRIPNLCVVSGGARTEQSADLLGSRNSKEVFATLSQGFDWVVIDSPPLTPVVDACLLAHAGSEVLFVIGAGQTSRRAARQAIDQLEAAGVPIAGAVLNRADVREVGDHYSRYYDAAHPQRRTSRSA